MSLCFPPRFRALLAGGFLVLLPLATRGATFFVSPDGADRSPGTQERPWASLAGARDAVRASGLLGREPVEVVLSAGTYYLPETVVFTAADSGGLDRQRHQVTTPPAPTKSLPSR